jgi:hypothetical protein
LGKQKPLFSRRLLHNAFLIQVWAATVGIVAILLCPLAMWLIQIPYFVLGYLVSAFVVGIGWGLARAWVVHLEKKMGPRL